MRDRGEMAEWSIAADSKSVVRFTVPGVRIPLSPPLRFPIPWHPVSSPSPQVQFDPSAARFGAARSQKRLEDDRLLVGKGLYSDDRQIAGQAWLIIVRSPHAHARIGAVDLTACRGAAGVSAAWQMSDLRVEGVR